MNTFKKNLLIVFLFISTNSFADKEIFYSDDKITIYTDNTIVQTGQNTAPVFKPSSTWIEEDYFTQQDKYCEVDSKYIDKLKKGLENKPSK